MRIAFGYRMGSGKDTAVEYLIKRYGGAHMSFAGPLYNIMHYAQTVCGFKQVKDRKFLQYIGTDWARAQEDDVWVRIMRENTPQTGNAFLSDVRFPNELQALKDDGWTCVRLIRDLQDDRKDGGSHTHPSEIALDSVPDKVWDYTIYNNGSLEEFFVKLDNMVSMINETKP